MLIKTYLLQESNVTLFQRLLIQNNPIRDVPKSLSVSFSVVHCRDPAIRLCLIVCPKIRWLTCLWILSALHCMFLVYDIYNQKYENEMTGFKATVDEIPFWEVCLPFLKRQCCNLGMSNCQDVNFLAFPTTSSSRIYFCLILFLMWSSFSRK